MKTPNNITKPFRNTVALAVMLLLSACGTGSKGETSTTPKQGLSRVEKGSDRAQCELQREIAMEKLKQRTNRMPSWDQMMEIKKKYPNDCKGEGNLAGKGGIEKYMERGMDELEEESDVSRGADIEDDLLSAMKFTKCALSGGFVASAEFQKKHGRQPTLEEIFAMEAKEEKCKKEADPMGNIEKAMDGVWEAMDNVDKVDSKLLEEYRRQCLEAKRQWDAKKEECIEQ